MTFWTADHHLWHKTKSGSIIEYANRPFKNLDEMHEYCINEWNKVVGMGDLVWYLGDFSFGNKLMVQTIRKYLNGKIILLMGNHDRIKNNNCGTFKEVYRRQRQPIYTEVDGYKIAMAHRKEALAFLDKTKNDLFLHGHSHGNAINEGKYFDVGVDNCPNFAPVTLEQILKLTL